MATIKFFEDIEVWQKARSFSSDIYSITLSEKFSKDFGLKDQIRRSSGSIMDNIAEGFERGGKKEFVQFLSYAKGSAGEVRSQLHRAFDQQYITEESFTKLKNTSIEISKMINGFINYLNKTEIKGIKFKEL